MALELWDAEGPIKKLPPVDRLVKRGRRRWDAKTEAVSAVNNTPQDSRPVFTMPGFGLLGRWGNMVFQYMFIRLLAENNQRDIELTRSFESISSRMALYQDMQYISDVKTAPEAFIIMDYQSQVGYIPNNLWRAMYVATVRKLKCFFVKDVARAMSEPLPHMTQDMKGIELEGAFIVKSYSPKNKEFLLTRLLQPEAGFAGFVRDCIANMGAGKTVIGIHIRRGDTLRNPLGQQFDLPVPVRCFNAWLQKNLPKIKNPVLFVSSDDPNVYQELEAPGVEIFTLKKLLPGDARRDRYGNFEQADWEVLRNSDILLISNSTFSFSAALLNKKGPECYRFSVRTDAFQRFDPWESEPLQIYGFSRYVWTTVSTRFRLVQKMVNSRMARSRVAKDILFLSYWKATRFRDLYYIHDFSMKYIREVFNLSEVVRVPERNVSDPNGEVHNA